MITKSKMKKINKHKSKPTSIKANKLKFNKQITSKMRKQPVKFNPVQKIQNIDEDNDQDENMLEMIETDDLIFLKKAVMNRSYNILNKIRYSEPMAPKVKKQKLNGSDEELEVEYEKETSSKIEPLRIPLLPIKTKSGIISQTIVRENEDQQGADTEDFANIESNNIDEFDTNKSSPTVDLSEPISTIQLLASRSEALKKKKIYIGSLSSGFLENPEEKITNLRSLLDLLDEEIPEIHYTVKKLVIISLVEIFKDVLPSYEIKHFRQEGVKLKKDTLKLYKYEEILLLQYKKYLQKLEKYGFRIIRKKGQVHLSDEETKLSILAVQSMCELLTTHPYFNFAQNIAQALVPLMNNRNKRVRQIITNSLKIIFKEDKKGEITLKVLRCINNYIKFHSNIVHTEMLEVLLSLNLKGVSLDQEKELDKKQKKLKAHKSRIIQLSKKEKKRAKKLKEVEKELLETKAEENKDAKMKNLTEITKIVFNIYFRILKNTNNTKLLGSCLEGLAKFAHYINLEFSLDIITALDHILSEDWLNSLERLHCMQTVFAILSGQGEALNVDPSQFYNRLYKDLLTFNMSMKKDEIVFDIIKTLDTALIKRRKKITNKRTIGFVKRMATLCLQLLHGGSIGCLAVMKTIMTLNRFVDILLDTDSSGGEGRFLTDVDDPEYCNASNTALYEIIPLVKHYHPTVGSFASSLMPSARGNLFGIYTKMSPEQLYTEFNMSEMAFNPAVPVPKTTEPKSKLRNQFVNQDFYEKCIKDIKTYPQSMLFSEIVM